ncbi:MAG: DUF1800 domain-containing protein [Planctomycetota bacterium]
MAMNTSLSPIRDDRFDAAAARHLLWRVGYGGGWAEVQRLAGLGLDAAVDELVDYQAHATADLPDPDLDPDVIRNATDEERRAAREARRNGEQAVLDQQRRDRMAARSKDRRMLGDLKRWWFERMVRTDRPAEDRLTLLWHGHFASSHRQVQDTYLMYRQHRLFRENANGSFADLARGVVRDPAMLKYLNNNRNNKRRPNENLARELMELFTLGVGNYTERDIKEGARALTGYHLDDHDFVFRENQHDPGPKTILGRTAAYDGDLFVERLLAEKACSKFIALKLYDHFVADVGDVYDDVPRERRHVIDNLAARLRRRGYQLRPVLTTLFKSQHFYDPAVVGKKIKDPSQLLVGTIRTLGTPPRDARALDQAMRSLGMEFFAPPTVDGWDGGRNWINTSTLFVRQNLTTYLISGRHQNKKFRPKNNGYDPASNRSALGDGVDPTDPVAVTDRLLDTLVGSQVPPARRAPAHRFVADREPGKALSKDGLIALLCLITAMPEYQLC